MSVIVSCDPGGIKPGTNAGTGYAVLDTEDMKILDMTIANHKPSECVDYVHILTELAEYAPAITVCEDFKPRWGQKFELDSVYLIGALQGAFGESNLKLVMPSVHMGVVPKPKLTALMKAQGYAVGKGHSRMALSVAVYYAAFKLKDKQALVFLSS